MYAAKIKATGVTPVYEGMQNGWHQVLPLFETGGNYLQSDPEIYNKLNNNKVNIKDVKGIKTVLTQLKEFQTLGYFGKDFMSNTVEGGEKAFADGKAAIVLDGFGWEQNLAKDFPATKDNVGVFVQPWGDNKVLGINPASNAYFANAKSENKDEAVKFFRYLAQAQVLQKRLDGDPNSLQLCWPEIKPKYPQSYIDYIATLKKATVVQVGVKYIDPQWMDVGKDIAAMYSGAMTPDDVMNSISKRRDDQAKLQKDPAWVKVNYFIYSTKYLIINRRGLIVMDRNKTYPWYFASGALLLFFILCFIPSVIGVFYSFTDWNSFSDKVNFVGFDNFKTIFISDKTYLTFIGNTVYFTVFTTALKTIIGFDFCIAFY